MIAECSCQQCGVNIEFDIEQANQFVACPSCGQQTRLLLPSKSAQKSSTPVSTSTSSLALETLKQVRQNTCYKTLRSLIDVVAIIFFVAAVLLAVASILTMFVSPDIGLASGIVKLILGLIISALVAVLAVAWKQAALLLVDIADCQISLVGKNR